MQRSGGGLRFPNYSLLQFFIDPQVVTIPNSKVTDSCYDHEKSKTRPLTKKAGILKTSLGTLCKLTQKEEKTHKQLTNSMIKTEKYSILLRSIAYYKALIVP